jgi:hypothetical protein
MMRPPNTSVDVNHWAEVHHIGRAWLVPASDGRLIRVPRHSARNRLITAGFTRAQAEQRLDEVKEYYASHPDEALGIKKRHVRDSTNIPLTEDELTQVALHGRRKQREAYARRWRNGEETP